MKKIVRPDSTTLMIDFAFHLCKNEDEIRNALIFEKEDDLVVFGHWVDADTFTPMILFALKREGSLLKSLKYAADFSQYTMIAKELGLKYHLTF